MILPAAHVFHEDIQQLGATFPPGHEWLLSSPGQ